MPAEVYHARSVAPFLPESRDLVRIAALGFDIRFNPQASGDGKKSYSIRFPPNETPLRDCIPIARLIVLSEAGDPVRVRLILDNSTPGALVTEATVLADLQMNPSEKLLQLARSALRAQRLAQLAGLPDDFPMYREELEAQSPTLQLLDGEALRHRESGTFLEVPMPFGLKAEELESLAVLMPFRICLGGQWILAITSTEGAFQLADIDGVPTISTKRARQRLVAAYILIGGIDQQLDTLCEVLSVCVADLEADGYCVVRPDRAMCVNYVQPTHAGDERPDSEE